MQQDLSYNFVCLSPHPSFAGFDYFLLQIATRSFRSPFARPCLDIHLLDYLRSLRIDLARDWVSISSTSMSQASATPVSSYPSQVHEQSEIHSCRWAWCRLIFSTNTELAHHVIHEHVQNAVPVLRKDLTMLRRVEEGFGESLSLSGLGLSYPQDSQESSTSKGKQGTPCKLVFAT